MEKELRINIEDIIAGTFLFFTKDDEITVDELYIYIDRIKQELYWRGIYFMIFPNLYDYLKKSKYFTLNGNIISLKKSVSKNDLKNEIKINDELIDSMISESVINSTNWEIMLKRNVRKHTI